MGGGPASSSKATPFAHHLLDAPNDDDDGFSLILPSSSTATATPSPSQLAPVLAGGHHSHPAQQPLLPVSTSTSTSTASVPSHATTQQPGEVGDGFGGALSLSSGANDWREPSVSSQPRSEPHPTPSAAAPSPSSVPSVPSVSSVPTAAPPVSNGSSGPSGSVEPSAGLAVPKQTAPTSNPAYAASPKTGGSSNSNNNNNSGRLSPQLPSSFFAASSSPTKGTSSPTPTGLRRNTANEPTSHSVEAATAAQPTTQPSTATSTTDDGEDVEGWHAVSTSSIATTPSEQFRLTWTRIMGGDTSALRDASRKMLDAVAKEARRVRESVQEFASERLTFTITSAAPSSSSSTSRRIANEPLRYSEWRTFLEKDGGVKDEAKLRQRIFHGGIDPPVRPIVWRYLLKFYPFDTPLQECHQIGQAKCQEYDALFQRWKTRELLFKTEAGEPTNLEGSAATVAAIAAAAEGAEEAEKIVDSDDDRLIILPGGSPPPSANSMANGRMGDAADWLARLDSLAPEIRERKLYQLQARTHDLIRNDVVRTDRQNPLFANDNNPNLTKLFNILATYAEFNREVAYAQGMNDLAAQILSVVNDEAEAFWCFVTVMDRMQGYFHANEQAMNFQLMLLAQLLAQADRVFYNYLVSQQAQNCFFAYRWLLLNLKREFSFDDSLRIAEVLWTMPTAPANQRDARPTPASSSFSSSSSAAQQPQAAPQVAQPRSQSPTPTKQPNLPAEDELGPNPFALFMCLAVMSLHRDNIMEAKLNDSDLLMFASTVSQKLDLTEVLYRAETLFWQYTRGELGSPTDFNQSAQQAQALGANSPGATNTHPTNQYRGVGTTTPLSSGGRFV
ncbi:hypothetical protein CAOG_02388 [Capsaspora owczarzaki ATCC 30864]|uniref:Rab-GAP TBC domain-containing protein n=1 Tax=Capsaspora owczarzaki (strain ATCC 30864) TaxID=595528 RepID=A0A0D2VM67_CAPO3|nr:hypothetical protein CAOG_02388 [Capsaspora owczarzaki ATCC 30864]KJE91222.1 hypothetical protein CAOG_002388 [Capsaspora owczarzaki ATCC 30864]|eukprot:XP_004349138.1 hypothetical protein CAOG_02388 [Capsaspora owczarzaki ATCC 30864]